MPVSAITKRAHANAGIRYHKTESGLVLEPGHFVHGQGYFAAPGGEFDGISQNVDENLVKPHIVPQIKIPGNAFQAVIPKKTVLATLSAEHIVNASENIPERIQFPPDNHFSGFDARHIKDVVDNILKMRGSHGRLSKIVLHCG